LPGFNNILAGRSAPMNKPFIPAEGKSSNPVNPANVNEIDHDEKKQKKIKQYLARKISSNVILSVIPFPAIFLLFPIFLLVLGIIIAFLLVAIIVLLSLLLLLSPALTLKRICPKLHLTGYQPITDVAYHDHDHAPTEANNNNSNNKPVIMPLPLFSTKSQTARCNNKIPMLTEVRAFLSLSDFVYMYIDFRKLVMLGKMPVDFKYIMLECDTMNQSDIIRGVPHERPAYGPNGEGGAGILPFTLIATVLRFLNAEAMRHRMENIDHVLTGGPRRRGLPSGRKSRRFLSSLRSNVSSRLSGGGVDDSGATVSLYEDLEVGGNGGTIKMENHLLEKTDLTTQDIKQMGRRGENDVYGGLAMFEKLFLKSLKHVTPDCGR